MSLKEANKLAPSIHLEKIIKSLAPSDVTIDRIIVASPDYLKNLTDILSSTSKDVIQTYLIWKVIQAHASEIEADELKPYTRFVNELQGKVRYILRYLDIADLVRIPTRPQKGGELV